MIIISPSCSGARCCLFRPTLCLREERETVQEKREEEKRGEGAHAHEDKKGINHSARQHSESVGCRQSVEHTARWAARPRCFFNPSMARAPPPAPSAGQPAAEALKGEQDTQAALTGTGDVADRDEAFGVSFLVAYKPYFALAD